MSFSINRAQVYAENIEKENDSGMSSAIKLLLSCKQFVSDFLRMKPNCEIKKDHFCLVCGTRSVIQSVTATGTINTENLEKRLSKVYSEQQLFLSNSKKNPFEVVFALLNAIHCNFIRNFSEGTDEHAINFSCEKECPAHKVFYLGIDEKYVCKCKNFTNNSWDYSTFCQNLNISEVLQDMDTELTKELLNVPNFKLKTEKLVTNSVNFLKKLTKKLENLLKTAETEICPTEDCSINKSKIFFTITNYPEIYLLNLLSEVSNLTHLESFLATVSISQSFTINKLYGNGNKIIYNLKWIIFYGREQYQYACRNRNLWSFPGLDSNSEFFELLKEITVMNYFPVGVVYKKSGKKLRFFIET